MSSRLVHPQLMQTLQQDFFTQFCTIQRPISHRNMLGEDEPTWEDVPGCVAIPCRVSAGSGWERRTNEMKYLDATHIILLAGTYDDLDEKMQAIVEGQTYEIVLPEASTEGAMTRLMTRVVR